MRGQRGEIPRCEREREGKGKHYEIMEMRLKGNKTGSGSLVKAKQVEVE